MADWIYGTGYHQYLQQTEFVRDLTTARRDATREMVGSIEGSALLGNLDGLSAAGSAAPRR
ncbi:MAG: hypothetical protein HYV07_05845 [Deltaproteobacteria bacterium]|nr:hypothetical protein [Deltaproteobacteria bacterium]